MTPNKKKPTSAVGYVRVSGWDRVDNGTSLPQQEAAIRAFCKAHRWKLRAMYTDAGRSGATTEKRPQFQRMLKNIRPGQAVVVTRLDRLTRSIRDLPTILDNLKGVSLVSLSENLDTGTPAGELMLNLLVSISQWERRAISERLGSARAYRKSRLEPYGQTPYGFEQKGNRLVPVPREQKVIADIKAWRAKGKSYEWIAEELNSKGVPTKNRGKWWGRMIWYMEHNTLHKQIALFD